MLCRPQHQVIEPSLQSTSPNAQKGWSVPWKKAAAVSHKEPRPFPLRALIPAEQQPLAVGSPNPGPAEQGWKAAKPSSQHHTLKSSTAATTPPCKRARNTSAEVLATSTTRSWAPIKLDAHTKTRKLSAAGLDTEHCLFPHKEGSAQFFSGFVGGEGRHLCLLAEDANQGRQANLPREGVPKCWCHK